MPWYNPQSPHESFTINVDWPLSDGNWINCDLSGQTGITRYRVHRNDGNWVYDYILEIDTQWENYEYYFEDGEPDRYHVTSSSAGSQTIKYNSKSPGIRKIEGCQARPASDFDKS
ncbi:hypothetical protein EJ07DRAFT_151677 [Lizonia empirigonia]|nr:hypothetical protein EJ07DRAFT_151677 [Lizonia empirigonia]